MSPADRFWAKVDRGAPNECWTWQAALNPNGYGYFWFEGTMRLAHRVAYVLEHGSIPRDLTVDHTCANRACVNPAHFELVTAVENALRAPRGNAMKTHCKRGHPLDEANTYVRPDGKGRDCKRCKREWLRASRGREREAVAA